MAVVPRDLGNLMCADTPSLRKGFKLHLFRGKSELDRMSGCTGMTLGMENPCKGTGTGTWGGNWGPLKPVVCPDIMRPRSHYNSLVSGFICADLPLPSFSAAGGFLTSVHTLWADLLEWLDEAKTVPFHLQKQHSCCQELIWHLHRPALGVRPETAANPLLWLSLKPRQLRHSCLEMI